MNDFRIGLQIYSLRESFADRPEATLQAIAEMGYQGVELTYSFVTDRDKASFYKEALEKTQLACLGCLTSWSDVQPDKIEETIARNRILGSPFIVIGSVPTSLIPTRQEAERVIAYMSDIGAIMQREGFLTGYHNHDSDFFHKIGEKTFFELVFDNTSSDFIMLLDTGNTIAGGYDPVELLTTYPGRSSFLHLKGFSQAKGYLAYIGDDQINWPLLLDCAIKIGGLQTASVEFGKRGEYDPFERARSSLKQVQAYLSQIEGVET